MPLPVIAGLGLLAKIAGVLKIAIPAAEQIAPLIKLLSGGKGKMVCGNLRLLEIDLAAACEDIPALMEREDIPADVKWILRNFVKESLRLQRNLDLQADILQGYDDDVPRR